MAFLVAGAVLTVTATSGIAHAQRDTTSDLNDAIDTNTVDSSRPSVRLDPYIRKALLKALSELEESPPDASDAATDTEVLRTGDDVTAAPNKQGIQIHSFIVNGQSAYDNANNTAPHLAHTKLSIGSSTAGNVEKQVTASLPTRAPLADVLQSSQSANIQQVRSVQSTSSTGDRITTTPNVPTTTTTTTTTTPKPTHNDDGENIEDVNKQDVQVFQAPLVAAFTVQQDSQGLPKKVIPIFQQTNIQTPATSLPPTRADVSAPLANNVPFDNINRVPSDDFISQQLILQKQLEDKQRVLEEQLRLLLIQQRQQEELLRKQQFFLQQKEQQRQQQLLFEQQQLRRQQQVVEQQRLPVPQNAPFQRLPANAQQNQNGGARPQGPVTIQPSVSLEQSVANQQQLPSREAVDFLLHLRNQRPEQFPLQENHIPQGISNFLNPHLQNFNQASNFNQPRPEDQFRPKHGNRVFRHEAAVGNFGSNNQNFNRFNPNFDPFYQNQYQFQSRGNQFNPDTELKHLFTQNGLNGRSQEDLNIVSKVLALNHGVPFDNNVSNRLSFDQRRHVRPL